MNEPFDEPTMRGHTGSRYYEGRKVFGGRFLLQKRIGRGGMGEVWLAQDAELSQGRAIKFLPPEIASDERAVGQLRREARAGMELAHPRIVRTSDFYSEDDDAAVVMEYVEGRTMSAMQAEKEEGFLEVSEIEEWVKDVVEALRYAHGEMNRVHRDIKPQNVMVEKGTGRAKLMDFGISRRISDTHTMLTGADAAGTLAYSSPQQVLGESPSVADDIYSLGATIYDLLTGTPPFFRGDLRTQVQKSTPPSMADRRRELVEGGMMGSEGEAIPDAWEALVSTCLSKDLGQRPQTMEKFVALMEGKAKPAVPTATPPTLPPAAKPQPAPQPVERQVAPVQPQPQPAPTPTPTPASKVTKPRGSNKGLKVLVGVLVLLVAGLGGYMAIMVALDGKDDPLPVVVDPVKDPVREPVDDPVKGPGKLPLEVVKIPDKGELAKVPWVPATTPPKEDPVPEPPKKLTRAEVEEIVGEVSQRYATAGDTGMKYGQETVFADRLNYFGTWMSKYEATSMMRKHQEQWPERKYAPEKPEVTLAWDGKTAEVRMWITHESGNAEKVSSARIRNYLKWDTTEPRNLRLLEQLELSRENSRIEFTDGSPWVGGKTDKELRDSVARMAVAYYRAGGSDADQSQLAMMASQVNYFGEMMGHLSIAADLGEYARKWPFREYKPDTTVPVTLDGDGKGATVQVWFEMTMRSATEEANGRMRGRLHIRWDSKGRAGITEASISDKGTMTTRPR